MSLLALSTTSLGDRFGFRNHRNLDGTSRTTATAAALAGSVAVSVVYALHYVGRVTGLYAALSSNVLLLTSDNLAERIGIPLLQQYGMLLVPDCLIRFGIRVQLRHHLRQLRSGCGSGSDGSSESDNDGASGDDDTHKNKNATTNQVITTARPTTAVVERTHAAKMRMVTALTHMPVATHTADANTQHYEVPAAFYDACLGPCKKYSSGYWRRTDSTAAAETTTFAQSEIDMLQLYCDRAGLSRDDDNNDNDTPHRNIVDLGCGWGSLTLYVAQHYPRTHVTGISNSHSQRDYIVKTAAERGLTNITILTVRCCCCGCCWHDI
jgi:Mycolic acid cyclopropane synthetase